MNGTATEAEQTAAILAQEEEFLRNFSPLKECQVARDARRSACCDHGKRTASPLPKDRKPGPWYGAPAVPRSLSHVSGNANAAATSQQTQDSDTPEVLIKQPSKIIIYSLTV